MAPVLYKVETEKRDKGEEVEKFKIKWEGKWIKFDPVQIKAKGGSGIKPKEIWKLDKVLVSSREK